MAPEVGRAEEVLKQVPIAKRVFHSFPVENLAREARLLCSSLGQALKPQRLLRRSCFDETLERRLYSLPSRCLPTSLPPLRHLHLTAAFGLEQTLPLLQALEASLVLLEFARSYPQPRTENLARIGALAKLRSLSIPGHRIDVFLRLAPDSLRRLKICESGEPFTDVAALAETLARLRQLRSLRILQSDPGRGSILPELLDRLDEKTKSRLSSTLHCLSNQLCDESALGASAAAAFPHLRSASLSSLAQALAFPQLRWLRLKLIRTGSVPVNLAALADLPHLRHLSLHLRESGREEELLIPSQLAFLPSLRLRSLALHFRLDESPMASHIDLTLPASLECLSLAWEPAYPPIFTDNLRGGGSVPSLRLAAPAPRLRSLRFSTPALMVCHFLFEPQLLPALAHFCWTFAIRLSHPFYHADHPRPPLGMQVAISGRRTAEIALQHLRNIQQKIFDLVFGDFGKWSREFRDGLRSIGFREQ